MEIRYYIYALNIDENCITAALRCPDEKTTRQALRIAREKVKDVPDWFRFDYVKINVAEARMRSSIRAIQSSLSSLPPHGLALLVPSVFHSTSPGGNLDFDDIDKLEFIVSQTKAILLEPKHSNRHDIRFMREVELATEREDVIDRLAKIKGRWVTQNEFLDKMINADSPRSVKKLHELRSKPKGSVEWSKKKPSIGIDAGGNFLEITKVSDNPTAPNRYRYFLRREHDLRPQG